MGVNQAALYLWDDEDTLEGRTYFWYGRRDTFDNIEAISERFNLIGRAGVDQMTGLPSSEMQAAAEVMARIYNEDSNNTFSMFIVDYAIEVVLRGIFQNRIPMDNIRRIAILEDGGVNSLRALAGGSNGHARLDTQLERLRNRILLAHQGRVALTGGIIPMFPYTIALAALFDQAELWSNPAAALVRGLPALLNQSPLLESVNNRFNYFTLSGGRVVNVMNLTNDFFETASQESIEGFRQAMFGTAVQDALEQADGRPVIVFTGTWYDNRARDFGFADSGANTHRVVLEKIIELFGDAYNIVYKGHPGWPITEGFDNGGQWVTNIEGGGVDGFNEFTSFMFGLTERDDINFNIIPCQIPMDMIMLFFTDVALNVGGFDSSLFRAANRDMNPGTPHNVRFLVGPLGQENLNALNDGHFDRQHEETQVIFRPLHITPANIAGLTIANREGVPVL